MSSYNLRNYLVYKVYIFAVVCMFKYFNSNRYQIHLSQHKITYDWVSVTDIEPGHFDFFPYFLYILYVPDGT